MFSLYNLVLFIHIVAVIVWIGGMIALTILNARLARETDPSAWRALSKQNGFFGRAVMGPSAIITLLAGGALMGLLGAGFTFWMVWGLVGVFGSIALGAIVQRRAGLKAAEALNGPDPDPARLARLRRRLALTGMMNILLLLSTVWAMVFKPTF